MGRRDELGTLGLMAGLIIAETASNSFSVRTCLKKLTNKIKLSFITVCARVYDVCVCMWECGHACATIHVWKSEDNFQESVLPCES